MYYFDKDKDKVQTKSDRGTEIYTRVDSIGNRDRCPHREAEVTISGHSATVVEQEDRTLKVQKVGQINST